MATSYRQGLIQKINEYCFREIWNETAAEYRVNIRLKSVTGRYLRGSVTVGSETIPMPLEETQFLVFQTGRAMFQGGLNIQRGEWIQAQNILGRYKTLLYLYTVMGKLIPRKQIYVFISRTSDKVFIAVPKKPIVKIFGNDYDDVYLTLYRDSDQPNDITCESWYADAFNMVGSTAGLLTYLSNSKNANLAGTTVLVNGMEVDHEVSVSYVAGDYIEILCDRNVIGAYDVDVSDNTTGYYSDASSQYREILHCPKSLNPTNHLITHNTCTLSVRRTDNKGLYLHRVEDTSVGQITHNDLSVATDVVDAYRDHLEDQNIHIHVRVRTHRSDNILISELFYMTFLYRCNDEEIIRHMRGELDAALPFWKASELEKSIYTRMMFNTPNNTDDQILTDYIEGLGYHTVAAIIAPHVYHGTMPSTNKGVTVKKPIALQGRPVRPLVWIRGIKLRDDQYTFVDQLDGTVRVTLVDTVYFIPGDTVSVILVESGATQPYAFYPTVSETTIKVPFKDVRVFEEIPLAQTAHGQTISSDFAYREVEFQSGTLMRTNNADGSTTVIAGASLYDKTLIVQNRYYSWINVINLDTAINTTKGALTAPLTVMCINDNAKIVPLLGVSTLEGYLNGNQLIHDLDMTYRPLKNGSGHVILSEVVITAADYLSYGETGNRIELIAHTGSAMSMESGFVFDGKVSYDDQINIWHPPLARCYVKGKLIQDPLDNGTYLEPGVPTLNGDPYQIMVMLPGAVAEVLVGYDQVTNINRLTAIRNYFGREIDIDKSFLIMDQSHRIFSPYMAEIIKDVVTGTFEPVNDPDPVLFLAQFADYHYLKDRDPGITDPDGVVDRRYADVLTTYVDDWAVPDPTTYAILTRLANAVLPNDPSAIGDTF